MTTFPNASAMISSPNPSSPVNVTPSSVVAKSTFDVKAVAVEIARLLSDDKCSDITLLDVRGISSVQDFVILASGTSDRQMRSAAIDVKNLLPTLGSSVFRTSIDDQSTWIVVDCVDTVIHIFEPNTRAYYDLESMWGDAPKVEWLRAGQKAYTPESYTNEPGDSDEPAAPRQTAESSEPDADMELTTATAETFVEDIRTSVSKKAPKTKKAAPPAPPAPPAAKMKPAAKMLSSPSPAPKAKPAAKAKSKPAAKKAGEKSKAAAATAKKAAAKKAAPAKKAPAKVAKKAPAKKVAKPVKKAAPAAAKPAKKAAKKGAKKK